MQPGSIGQAHRERSGSPVLTGDGQGGQGRLSEADGELIRARATAVRRHDSGRRNSLPGR
jgi:hypothetical protein